MSKDLILFDFDGTLVNSSPGITHTMKLFAEKYKLRVLSSHEIESVISQGSSALVKAVMGIDHDHPKMLDYRNELLALYKRYGIIENQFYPDVVKLLETLEQENYPWGIVSNGRSPMVDGTLSNLGFANRSLVTICADNVSKGKPSPEGLLKASQQASYSPKNTWYIGDAITDIQAGKAAGMTTVIALYGYVPEDSLPETWGADYMISTPLELLDLLDLKAAL